MKNKALTIILSILILFMVLLGGLVLISKITNEQESPDQADQTTENTETTTEKAEATTEVPQEPEKKPFTMFFGGDVLLEYGADDNYDRKGVEGVVSPDLLNEMQNADLCMVNQEFPFGTGGTKAPDKQFTFKSDPKYVQVLKDMGVDIVSLANNHVLDFGPDVLSQTFTTLDNAQIDYVGAGATKERAKAWKSYDLNGTSVAVLSATRVIPVTSWNIDNSQPGLFCTYDPTQLLEQIKLADQEHDMTVVFVHWGKESKEYPEDYQRTMAKQYIDAGADLVVGGHAHVIQGTEYYKGVPIIYSLGNYIFRQANKPSAVLKVHVDEQGQMKAQMIPIASADFYTYASENEAKTSMIDYIESLSYDVELDEEGYLIPPEIGNIE